MATPYVTPTSYKGVPGTWNNFGEFVPSTPASKVAQMPNVGAGLGAGGGTNSGNAGASTSISTNAGGNASSSNRATSPYDPISNTGAGVGIANVGASAGMIVPPGVENREASYGEVLDMLASMSQNQQAGREAGMDIEERTPGQFTEYLTGYEQQRPVAPALTPPVMPAIDLSYQMPAYMSWEEALRQAGQQLDPQTELSRMAILRAYMEQRQRLPQLLNARGQMYGGLRAGQEAELTQDERRALDELALRATATKSQMAQGIQDKDYARAKSIADTSYQNKRDRAELLMQQWQAQQDLYNREQDRQDQSKRALVEMLSQLQQASDLAEQRTYDRQRQEQQDRLAMLKWFAQPEAQDWYLPSYQQQMQANIANTRRSASAPYGRGSSTPKPTATEIKAQKDAEAEAYYFKYKDRFKTPTDMLAQMIRNYEAGTIDKYTLDWIRSYLTTNYDV